MRPIRAFLTKAVVPVVMAGALICQGASSADAAREGPCQSYANALDQMNQQIEAHNARRNNQAQPAEATAYNAEADQLNAAGQDVLSSLQQCRQQVQAAEDQAAQQAAQEARAETQAVQQAAQARAEAQAAQQAAVARQLAQAQARQQAAQARQQAAQARAQAQA
ncbi:MAG: hypothetical protein H0V41_01585, partial [Pseudonocardiales bacterium]|nr:hypothetical protein [Pseudonocardiales bacterium]